MDSRKPASAAFLESTWWSQSGSNRRPPACKAGALPAELWPRNLARSKPATLMVGLAGFEPATPRLSSVCSNQLSYRPPGMTCCGRIACWRLRLFRQVTCVGCSQSALKRSVKEVIQPQVPLRLPCYDFTPVIGHTVVGALLAVRLPTSGATDFHGVTGGVYKARERIHRRKC